MLRQKVHEPIYLYRRSMSLHRIKKAYSLISRHTPAVSSLQPTGCNEQVYSEVWALPGYLFQVLNIYLETKLLE